MDNHKGLRKKLEAQARLTDMVQLLHKTTLSRLGDMVILSNAKKPLQRVNIYIKKQRNMFQTENEDKSSGTDLNEMKISDFYLTESLK